MRLTLSKPDLHGFNFQYLILTLQLSTVSHTYVRRSFSTTPRLHLHQNRG